MKTYFSAVIDVLSSGITFHCQHLSHNIKFRNILSASGYLILTNLSYLLNSSSLSFVTSLNFGN